MWLLDAFRVKVRRSAQNASKCWPVCKCEENAQKLRKSAGSVMMLEINENSMLFTSIFMHFASRHGGKCLIGVLEEIVRGLMISHRETNRASEDFKTTNGIFFQHPVSKIYRNAQSVESQGFVIHFRINFHRIHTFHNLHYFLSFQNYRVEFYNFVHFMYFLYFFCEN